MRDLSELPSFLEELNKKFVYQTDELRHNAKEFWAVLDLERDKVYGDCEDYSLTIRKEFGGDIYFCYFINEGHAVLRLPNGMWIDNIHKKPVKELGTQYNSFNKYNRFQIFFKYYQSYVLKAIGKIVEFFKSKV